MSLSIPLKPLVLIGCPGSGRTAIIYHLTNKMPHKFQRVRVHTTKPPNQGDRTSCNYYFVDEKSIRDHPQKFITIAKTNLGNYYGISQFQVKRILTSNRIPVIKMTFQEYKENVKQNHRGKVFLYKDHIQCNILYVNIPNLDKILKGIKDSPVCSEESCTSLEAAKKQQEQACKYFMKADHIFSKDISESIAYIKSRLLQLY